MKWMDVVDIEIHIMINRMMMNELIVYYGQADHQSWWQKTVDGRIADINLKPNEWAAREIN